METSNFEHLDESFYPSLSMLRQLGPLIHSAADMVDPRNTRQRKLEGLQLLEMHVNASVECTLIMVWHLMQHASWRKHRVVLSSLQDPKHAQMFNDPLPRSLQNAKSFEGKVCIVGGVGLYTVVNSMSITLI